jgi:hypothetical protein
MGKGVGSKKTRSTFMLLWVFLTGPVSAQEVRVYFGNLHSHTSLSDGSGFPEQAYLYARDTAGLDFLAVTEHNHAQAGRLQNDPLSYEGPAGTSLKSTATRFTESDEFVALFGQEFSTISSGNHANVFEVDSVIRTSVVPNGDWRALLVDWIPSHLDSMGRAALLLLNHPATSSSPNDQEYGRDDFTSAEEWRRELDGRAQLINIINGPSHNLGPPGRPSESEFRRYLNLGFHLAPTADQDNHRPNWGGAAETRTGVVASSLTKSSILDALRSRQAYATEDRNLRLIGRINSSLMGSVIGVLPSLGSEIAIELSIEDDDEPIALYTIEVFADDGPGGEEADVVAVVNAQNGGIVAIPGVTFTGDGQYLFLRVTQSHDDVVGEDRAWLAPVWFEASPVPPPTGESTIALDVDLAAETARITNIGDQDIDVTGWTLVSLRGEQTFTFGSFVLVAGNTVTVTSGPDAVHSPPAFIRWTNSRIWNNDGDPGELRDAQGQAIARVPEENP